MINEEKLIDLHNIRHRHVIIVYTPSSRKYIVQSVLRIYQDDGSWLTNVHYSVGQVLYCRTLSQMEDFELVSGKGEDL